MLIVLLSCQLIGFAQQSHFIYIQSDNKQPFYVEFNKKSYSSSSTGYLIISKIPDGNQSVTLGFTGTKLPAFDFQLLVDADAGFALKNYNEKGWGLFNLQTMAITMGTASLKAATQPQKTEPAAPVATTKPAASNQFGDMLSQVVDDPDLAKGTGMQSSTAEKTTTTGTKPATKPAAGGTKPAGKGTKSKPVVTEKPVEAAEEDVYGNAATKGVIKAGEEQGDKGTAMVFIDFNNKGSDTVKIFIPEVKDSVVTAQEPAPADTVRVPEKQAAAEKPKEREVVKDTVVVAKETGAVGNPFYTKPAEQTQSVEQVQPVENKTSATVTTDTTSSEPIPELKVAAYNSNCTGGMASDKDLDKLRKRMVSEGADDKMIVTAKKAFKQKCYTTEQIKTLGMLFFTDESRYAFYDAAYPFVYDVTNYVSLEKMLLDDYFKKRFRAMLRP
ncbi:hypothetical protein FLA_0249 [Filimonas lacunae]|nr:hypothetical protein FLA_0249 [Filimonas lacunae]